MIINEEPLKSCIAEGNNAFWTLKDIFPWQMHPLLSASQIYNETHIFHHNFQNILPKNIKTFMTRSEISVI